MAKITLAGVDALTESGGVVSLPAAVDVIPAMPSGSILQMHSVFGEGAITNSSGTYTYYLIQSNPNQFSSTEQHTIAVVSKMTNSNWYFHVNDHIYYTHGVAGGNMAHMHMFSGWSFSSGSGYTYLEIGHNYHDARTTNNLGGQEMHSESAQQMITDIIQSAGTTVYFTYKTTRAYNGSEDGATLTIMEVAP
ncbi:MAG TPA: hypothetical protein DEZ08_08985 [Dehalococcoidia bacterium]|nr:hypothetical protein [Dehalococcoidia bacterium]